MFLSVGPGLAYFLSLHKHDALFSHVRSRSISFALLSLVWSLLDMSLSIASGNGGLSKKSVELTNRLVS